MKQKRSLLLRFTIVVWAASAWAQSGAPVPLLRSGQPVDWWFVFKFNTATFNGCGAAQRACLFGGAVQTYKSGFGQQFAVASSENAKLMKGAGCAGDTTSDPIGATFNQVYTGHYFYVLWNDQFDGSPVATLGAPWGHSKGMMAWDANGNGFVMQVSTPSWPGSGSAVHPREGDGNTLGCVADDDVLVSQHFFALKLNKGDVVAVLKGLANASVVTGPSNAEIVNNGGPADVQALVTGLGAKVSVSTVATITTLSTGVQLISKPSKLLVPTWQLVFFAAGRAITEGGDLVVPSRDSHDDGKYNNRMLGSEPQETRGSGHRNRGHVERNADRARGSRKERRESCEDRRYHRGSPLCDFRRYESTGNARWAELREQPEWTRGTVLRGLFWASP